jgi:hypothetical protein
MVWIKSGINWLTLGMIFLQHRSTTPQPAGASSTRREPLHLGIRDPNQSQNFRKAGSLDRGNKLQEIPAGMLTNSKSGLGEPGKTYLTGRDEIYQPRVAGKFILSTNGEPVNSTKIDHMRDLIQTEQPAAPILDQHTTYNRNHSKEGFPMRHERSQERDLQYKPQEVYYTGVPGNKRHPFEVKSRIR